MNPCYKKAALVWYLQRDGTYREAKVTISAQYTTLTEMPEAEIVHRHASVVQPQEA